MTRGSARMFAVRAAAFSASILFANGIYTPFFPIWLASKDLGPDQISAIYALPIVVRILLMPFMVGLADRLPSLGATGALYAAVAAVLFSVPIFFPSFWVDPGLRNGGAGLLDRRRPVHRRRHRLRGARAWHRLCAGAALGFRRLHDRQSPGRCRSATPLRRQRDGRLGAFLLCRRAARAPRAARRGAAAWRWKSSGCGRPLPTRSCGGR